MEENSKELKEKLFNQKELGWNSINDREKEAIYTFSNGYMNFLNKAKIEREFVITAKEMAEQNGFKDVTKCEFLMPGDKVYYINRDKSMYLAIIGTEKLEKGLQIVGAHIDSPRIDVKQNPLYENEDLAYLDTHYYGGIKKYQWVALPLALHGVIVKTDGTVQKVNIGEKEDDPVFVVTDLLIHLAGKQMEKKASTVIEGEKLDLLIGSRPLEKEEGLDEIALMHGWILRYLYEHQDKEIYQKDIEKEFSINRSTTSEMLKLMCKKGMIEREEVEYDARLKKIVLTESSRNHNRQIEDKMKEMHQKLIKDLSEEEINMFIKISDKLINNIKEDL